MQIDPIPGTNRCLIIDQRMLAWVGERIGGIGAEGFNPAIAVGIGLGCGGEIIAGVIYHDWQPRYSSIHLSMAAASPRWALRSSIIALLNYPFRQLGVRRVTTATASKNTRALRMNEGLGFVREGVCRFGAGDDDGVIMGLLREETPEWMGFRR